MKLKFMLHPLDPRIVEMCKKHKISFSIYICSDDYEHGMISGSTQWKRKKARCEEYKLYKLKKIG
jgi:hypothetical protein